MKRIRGKVEDVVAKAELILKTSLALYRELMNSALGLVPSRR